MAGPEEEVEEDEGMSGTAATGFGQRLPEEEEEELCIVVLFMEMGAGGSCRP